MSEYKLTFLYKKGLDYKTRNFIFLLVLLGLTVGLALLVNSPLKNTQVKLQNEHTKLRQEADIISSQTTPSTPLYEQIKELKKELALSEKIIPNNNDPTVTLSYIFDIFSKYHNTFNFNFRLQSSGEVENDKELRYNRYALSGSAFVNLLYVFVDQFERQPSLFVVETLEMRSMNAEADGLVDFNIEFTAYYTKTGMPIKDVKLNNLRERRLAYNIFYPRVYDPKNIDTDEFKELLNVESIEIIGMTQDKIFVRNNATQEIAILYINDRVQYGSLYKIDWEKQEAIFRVNPTGPTNEVRLKIQSK
ncbi:MAG: hypothetical protein WCX83_02680 [Candidatus Cloacimonas sp.]|nr:hypothetical protein [Candidatus Cloacimonadota bacterium]